MRSDARLLAIVIGVLLPLSACHHPVSQSDGDASAPDGRPASSDASASDTGTQSPDSGGAPDSGAASIDASRADGSTGVDAAFSTDSGLPACGAHDCAGCCEGSVCQSGSDEKACGGRGAPCRVCGPGESCTNGTCTPCEDDADCNDTWFSHCEASTSTCVACLKDSDCPLHYPTMTVCTADHRCLECRVAADCTKNLAAMGSLCDGDGRCRCAVDADCSANAYGHSCDPEAKLCSCRQSSECQDPWPVCQPWIGVSRACRPRCASEADCQSFFPAVHCDLATGRCFECGSDLDCPPWRPRCDPDMVECVECLTDPDCPLVNPQLRACLPDKTCSGCVSDLQCAQNPYAWGLKCLSPGESGSCGCGGDADCQGSFRGATCWTALGNCGCQSSAECKRPGAQCLENPVYVMTTCRVPCGGDTDCPDPSFSRCEPASQSCVRCLADEDCAKQDPYWTRCSPGHGCFECEVDLDCTGNPAALGPHCSIWDTGGSSCICMSGAECAGNPNGPKCLDSTCSCQGDDDCPAPRRCVRPAQPILASWKATVCQ